MRQLNLSPALKLHIEEVYSRLPQPSKKKMAVPVESASNTEVTLHIKRDELPAEQGGAVLMLSPFKVADRELNPAFSDQALSAVDRLLSGPQYLICHSSGRFRSSEILRDQFCTHAERLAPSKSVTHDFVNLLRLLGQLADQEDVLNPERLKEAEYSADLSQRLVRVAPGDDAQDKMLPWSSVEQSFCRGKDWLQESEALGQGDAFVKLFEELLRSACEFVRRDRGLAESEEVPYFEIVSSAYYLIQEYKVFYEMLRANPELRLYYIGHVPSLLQYAWWMPPKQDGGRHPVLIRRVQGTPGLPEKPLAASTVSVYSASPPTPPSSPPSPPVANILDLGQVKKTEALVNRAWTELGKGNAVQFDSTVFYPANLSKNNPGKYKSIQSSIEVSEQGCPTLPVTLDEAGLNVIQSRAKEYLEKNPSPPRVASPALPAAAAAAAAAPAASRRRPSTDGSFFSPLPASAAVADPRQSRSMAGAASGAGMFSSSQQRRPSPVRGVVLPSQVEVATAELLLQAQVPRSPSGKVH